VERVLEEDEKNALQIIFSHQDKSYTYTDATTFAVFNRVGLSTAFAFENHFKQFDFMPIEGLNS